MTQHISEKLKELRLRAGFSFRAAAAMAGMKTPSNWQHYEKDFEKDALPADIVIAMLKDGQTCYSWHDPAE